ncbi:MAG TPA: hypothetical protein VGF07_13250 [Stellaceae bacterium]|jgi:hypothetical protein
MATAASDRLGAAAIAEMLAARIDTLAPQLLPQGSLYNRRWWRCGSLLGEAGQSLAVEVSGPRRGRWRDYSGEDRGDALDLVAKTVCRGDLGEAIRWARRWLGLGELDDEERRRIAAAAERRRAAAEREAERQARHRRNDARALWLAAQPLARGDLVARYLRDRGIDLARRAKDGVWRAPRALRCHPDLWCGEAGQRYPAMVAAICDAQGRHVATHRTWLALRNLACDDAPKVGKAPIGNPKMTLGGYRGGLIRLARGASGRAWRDMPAGETLILGEGIEDALAAAILLPRFRAAAGVSLSAMASLALPPQIGRIILLAQNDLPGSPARETLGRLWRRWLGEGREVVPFPVPPFVKDIAALIDHPNGDFVIRRLLVQIQGEKAA